MTAPDIFRLGERVLIVRLSVHLDAPTNNRARALAATLEEMHLPGVTDVVPANSSIGIYCSGPPDDTTIRQAVQAALEVVDSAPVAPGPLHNIPVNYNGPDLKDVGDQTGLTRTQIIELHCSREYQVFAIGFAPGFGYLGELDERLAVPRRAEPRSRVPAGSVAIANRQTAIYPLDTPGGWNLIGVTSVRIFDPRRAPASLFAVGDRVRFVPHG